MFPHGLKTNIAVHLVVLLLLAMFLINFVQITAAQKDLLRSEISKGDLLLTAVEKKLTKTSGSYRAVGNLNFEKDFVKILSEAGISCMLVLDRNSKEIYFGGTECELKGELHRLTRLALRSGKKTTNFFGTTWGVFWKQSRNLILSVPWFREGNVVAGASIVLQLEGIYKTLRRAQQILLIYIFANTTILTLIGLYRLSRVIVKPITRLANRAEEYREDDEMFFLYEKEGNEFSKLSGALNRMLKRISADKEELQSAVQALEKANLELELAQKDIIRAEKLASVGRLSSGIAHEIGNPIGIVIGYLELLKQQDITADEKKEFIGRAENEMNRISTVIRQLLDFSKSPDTGLKAVSVHEIINDIFHVLKVQPIMKKINLKNSLAAESDTVLADSDQLKQVFLNLMLNAADAISSDKDKIDGEIEIASKVEAIADPDTGGNQSMLNIRVIDNGPGIPKENIDNIFDPFYTTKEPGKGTGLGLWVSFMMIEGIGGKITATSGQNKGTAIVLHLPLYSDGR